MILLITKYNLSPKWLQLFIFLIFCFILIKLHYFDSIDNIAECMGHKKRPLSAPVGQKTIDTFFVRESIQANKELSSNIQVVLEQESSKTLIDSPRSATSQDCSVLIERKESIRSIEENVVTQQPEADRKIHLRALANTDEAAYVDVKSTRTVNKYSDYQISKNLAVRDIIREFYEGFDYKNVSPEKQREMFQKATILQAHNHEHELLTRENETLKAEPKCLGVSANTGCTAVATVVGSIAGGGIAAAASGACTIS